MIEFRHKGYIFEIKRYHNEIYGHQFSNTFVFTSWRVSRDKKLTHPKLITPHGDKGLERKAISWSRHNKVENKM